MFFIWNVHPLSEILRTVYESLLQVLPTSSPSLLPGPSFPSLPPSYPSLPPFPSLLPPLPPSPLPPPLPPSLSLPPGAMLNTDSDVLYLSSIFKWFPGDFAPQGGVLKFISPYLPPEYAPYISKHDPALKYFEYNWDTNGEPPCKC